MNSGKGEEKQTPRNKLERKAGDTPTKYNEMGKRNKSPQNKFKRNKSAKVRKYFLKKNAASTCEKQD